MVKIWWIGGMMRILVDGWEDEDFSGWVGG